MTVHSRRLVRQEQQRTQATLWSEQLAQSRNQQASIMQPRSQGAWSAEQARLGSWRGGLGKFQIMGRTPGFMVGQADPLYQQDEDEDGR